MKTLYIDCTAGISGSRLIGALLDLKGENADEFERRMSWLRRYGCAWAVSAGPNGWGGIEAKPVPSGCKTFGFAEIEALLDESKLLPETKERALSAFSALKTAGCGFCGDEIGAPLLGACLVFEIVGALALLAGQRRRPYGRTWTERRVRAGFVFFEGNDRFRPRRGT